MTICPLVQCIHIGYRLKLINIVIRNISEMKMIFSVTVSFFVEV